MGESGNLVTEEEETSFLPVYNDDLLIHINQRTLNHRLIDKPDYKLNLRAFKTTVKKYDKLIWEINSEGQTAAGLWGVFNKYFKTVDTGCCSTEDGYRLFDLKTGKPFVSHSGDLKYALYPKWNYTGYQARGCTTFDFSLPEGIIGNLYYIELDVHSDKTVLNAYDIYCEHFHDDVRFEHTPEFEIQSKNLIKDNGFFQRFSLFKAGDLVTQLDTADFYLVLSYDTDLNVLIPVIDTGFIEDEMFTTDSTLSKNLRIQQR